MRADEFITMCEQDIETSPDREQLSDVVGVIREILNGQNVEVDHKKTVTGCFAAMRAYASAHKKGNSFYMGPELSKKIVAEYLGLNAEVLQLNAKTETIKRGKVTKLEDLI